MVPPPDDRRVITANEAQQLLGIPCGTVRAWASQKKIRPVSIGKDQQRWYRLRDILALAAETRRRARHTRPRRSLSSGERDIA